MSNPATAVASAASPETQVAIVEMFEKSGLVGLVLFVDILIMGALLYILYRVIKLFVDFSSDREKIETERSLAVERTAAALATLTSIMDRRMASMEDSLNDNTRELNHLREKVAVSSRQSGS